MGYAFLQRDVLVCGCGPSAEIQQRLLQALQERQSTSESGDAPCVVFLSCGCDGPLMVRDDGGGVDDSWLAAAGVRGLVRTARIEMPRARLLCIDSDALGRASDNGSSGSDASQVVAQVRQELASRDGNSEVAYRTLTGFPSVTISAKSASN